MRTFATLVSLGVQRKFQSGNYLQPRSATQRSKAYSEVLVGYLHLTVKDVVDWFRA